MLVRSAWTGPPAKAGTPAQPPFAPLQEKISGAEVSEDPGRDDRFFFLYMLQRQTLSLNFRSNSPVNVRRCGNIYYIFGHVHKIRSYSFGHLHLVKLTFLLCLTCFCK